MSLLLNVGLSNVMVVKRYGYQTLWLSSAVTNAWPVFGDSGVI
ncbi:hypothetical protein DDI_0537 [Dickeya dianthicola RNS04.9]|nr:hypothetical protein DDI_0537 [Dickeya dianthicola RNS04.9]